MSISYLPPGTQKLRQHPSRARRDGTENGQSKVVARQLRQMVTVAFLVLAADWGTKALMVKLSPGSTIPHYTHPNPLALLAVLAAAPIVLRVISTRLMVLALGICIGGCTGNLVQHMIGMPVTDFIPLPHALANPTCAAGHSCVLMCNVADLALWISVPLLGLALATHMLRAFRSGGRMPTPA